jgi:hypothetical protein
VWLIELLSDLFPTNRAVQPKEFRCSLLAHCKVIIFRAPCFFNHTYMAAFVSWDTPEGTIATNHLKLISALQEAYLSKSVHIRMSQMQTFVTYNHSPDQGHLNRLRSVRFQPSDRKPVVELTHRSWWLAVEHETECPLLRYLKRSDRQYPWHGMNWCLLISAMKVLSKQQPLTTRGLAHGGLS